MFLEVLNDALGKDRDAMLEAAVRVQDDLNEAAGVLLTLAPQVDRILAAPDMPDDAMRDFVARTYGRLTEGCFERVTNLLLFAMFVLKGSPKGWEDVSDWAGFGAKHLWLADAGDEPAFTAALEGVEAIVRNSDAHCELFFLEDGVRFVQTNFRTRTKDEITISDEELGRLLADLVRTVLSLSVAAQLFQADHFGEISGGLSGAETPSKLRAMYLELVLAATGLLEPEITEEGGLLTVRACVPDYQPPAALTDYVKTLFFVMGFYPEAEELALEVRWLGDWHCSLRAPAGRLAAFGGMPEHLAVPRFLALALSASSSSSALPERPDEQKLTELGFGVGCAAAYDYFSKVMQAMESDWVGAGHRAREALDYLSEFGEALSIPEEISPGTEGLRKEILQALGDVGHLYRTIVRVSRGALPAEAVNRAGRRYNPAAEKVRRFAETFRSSERLL
jgi:hypothetical protein